MEEYPQTQISRNEGWAQVALKSAILLASPLNFPTKGVGGGCSTVSLRKLLSGSGGSGSTALWNVALLDMTNLAQISFCNAPVSICLVYHTYFQGKAGTPCFVPTTSCPVCQRHSTHLWERSTHKKEEEKPHLPSSSES